MVNSSEFCPSMKLKALKAIEHIKSFLVLAMIAVALTVIPLSPPVSAQPLNSWSSTTSYPTGIANQSCVTNSGFIYCVGGFDGSTAVSNVRFAPISSSGVGTWASTNSYPSTILEQSCVTNSGFIYCVGGSSPSPTSDVRFAPISSSGVGSWTSTNSYPFSITEQSCVARASFVFCVGGLSFPIGLTSDVFFAPISSSGVGTWASTNSYPFPIFEQSCVTRASLIYCVGGNSGTSAVFFG